MSTDVAALTRELLRLGAALATEVSEGTGLRGTDRRALALLDELAGEPATPGALAQRLGLSAPATTALVDRLADAGYVDRVRDLPDRRQVRLQLTDRVREEGARVLGPVGRRIDAAAAGLTPDEAAAVARFLTAVLAEPAGVPDGPRG